MWYLVALILIAVAAVAILWPYLRSRSSNVQPTALDPRLVELYSRRDMLYQAVRNAQFDMQTGKLSEEDYKVQSSHLKLEAASVLKNIDVLEAELVAPELDERLELEVAAAREIPAPLKAAPRNGDSKASLEQPSDRFCVHCGGALRKGDQFCGQCGVSVKG